METVENMVKATLGEIHNMLSTDTVIGEPLSFEGKTVIPLLSVGFGFGAGGGSSEGGEGKNKSGFGGGTGGGGGIRPVAIIVIENDKVQLLPVPQMGRIATVVDEIGGIIPRIIEKRAEKKEVKKSEEQQE